MSYRLFAYTGRVAGRVCVWANNRNTGTLQAQLLQMIAKFLVNGNVLIVILMIPLVAPNLPDHISLIGLKDTLAILFLGVFQIGIAYLLFTKGIAAGVRSLDASIIGFIEPLLNPVWVFLILREQPSTYAILGGTIIIATVAAHTLAQYRSQNRLS